MNDLAQRTRAVENAQIAFFTRHRKPMSDVLARVSVEAARLPELLATNALLREENARLRVALEGIRDYEDFFGGPPADDAMQAIAREALA